MVIALFYLPIFPLRFFVSPHNQIQMALSLPILAQPTPSTLFTGSRRFQFVGWPIRMVEWRVAAMLGTGLSGRGDASRATEAHHSATTPPVEGPRNSFILQTLKAWRP